MNSVAFSGDGKYIVSGSEDKTIRIFEDWLHELMNEIGKEEFFEVLVEWLKRRI